MVGIGASAGGIAALQKLLPAIDTGCGIAFVVVQHLDPQRESMLPQVLERSSRLPVVPAENGMLVEANRVYVIPADKTLTVDGDRLRLSAPTEPHGLRAPIDSFLLSLARDKGERGACVILSGTGNDGTIGLRAVKEHGGLTIVQSDAEYDGMMRSAVRSGMVDHALSAEAIPKMLCDHFQHLDAALRSGKRIENEPAAPGQLSDIYALLRNRTGHDFSGYKDKTIARRVQRRMQVLQITDMGSFIRRLRKEPLEVDILLQDLLIGVTGFFRDAEAFSALGRHVIPRLFDGKGPNDTVRVWSPGCATGEEAYSIAMLLREHALTLSDPPKPQIFASDIDERALQTARAARYPAAMARDIPKDLLGRHLVREDGTYRIAGDLREICLFSSHNLLRDAPFSKLDLIVCRNLLIYLSADLQNRLIPLFHYALNEKGFLFLGSSENVTRHSRLFATIDKAYRIFQRREPSERRLPEFPLATLDSKRPTPAASARTANQPESLQSSAERQMLEQFVPAYVIVNAEGEVLHTSGRTGKYLELPAGTPQINIFSMARRGLGFDLRATLYKAINSGQPTAHSGIVVGTGGGRNVIDLFVQPLRSGGASDPAYMIVFRDAGAVSPDGAPAPEHPVEDREHDGMWQLEAELRATKDRLQSVTEELESSNEELKSSNEELASINEELQSANEELETSKEELQSTNEELQTVNSELSLRVDELSKANNDISNLLESTQIATVFLNRDLAIQSFTPAARDLFHLVESDAGRRIDHVRARFSADTVQEDAGKVLRTLSTIERHVESIDREARYVMRVLPYRTIDNVIGGVVITFTDITRITHAEAQIDRLTVDLRNRLDSLETLVTLLPVGVLFTENQGQVLVNRAGARLLGQGDEGIALRPVASGWKLYQDDRELASDQMPLQTAVQSGVVTPALEARLERADGSIVHVLISATPLFDQHGATRGAIAAIVDISARKSSESHKEFLLHELQHRVKNVVSNIGALAHRMLKTTRSLEDFTPAFQGRLKAIAGVHELLSAEQWVGADLQTLVRTILLSMVGAHEGRVTIDGPDISLTPNTASTMGMVIYELATNAVKYGALSDRAGRIRITWQCDRDAGRLRLSWIEEDGPPVNRPLSGGFGAGFIGRSVEYELDGKAELDPRPAGVRCHLEFPLDGNIQDVGDR